MTITEWMEDVGVLDGYEWVRDNQIRGWEYVWENCPSAGFYFGVVERMLGTKFWPSRKEYILLCCDLVEYIMNRESIFDKEVKITLKMIRSYFNGKCSVEKLGGWADVMYQKVYREDSPTIKYTVFSLTWTLAYIGNLSVYSEFSDEKDVFRVVEFVRSNISSPPSPVSES